MSNVLIEQETRLNDIKQDFINEFGDNNLFINPTDIIAKSAHYTISDLRLGDFVIIKRDINDPSYFIVPIEEITKQRIVIKYRNYYNKFFDIKTLQLTRDADKNSGWCQGILLLPSFSNYLSIEDIKHTAVLVEEIKRKHILLSNHFTYKLSFKNLDDVFTINESLNSYIELVKSKTGVS